MMIATMETTFGSVSPTACASGCTADEGIGSVCVLPALPGEWRVRRVTVGHGHGLRLMGLHVLTLPGLVRDLETAQGIAPRQDAVVRHMGLVEQAARTAGAMSGLGPNALGGEIPCDDVLVWTLDAANLVIGGDRILVANFRNRIMAPVYLPAIGALCALLEKEWIE